MNMKKISHILLLLLLSSGVFMLFQNPAFAFGTLLEHFYDYKDTEKEQSSGSSDLCAKYPEAEFAPKIPDTSGYVWACGPNYMMYYISNCRYISSTSRVAETQACNKTKSEQKKEEEKRELEKTLKLQGPPDTAPLMKDREKTSTILAERSLAQAVSNQVSSMRAIRSRIGDKYLSYEKDRLIGTIKDYDIVLRSQLYVQTKYHSILDKVPQVKKLSENNPDSKLWADINKVMEDTQVFYLLRKSKTEPKALKNISLSSGNVFAVGDEFKHNFFVPTLSDKQRVDGLAPALFATKQAAIKRLLAEVGLKDYILGAYIRSYLAERGLKDGIGSYLYGRKVELKDNPWAVSDNIWANAYKGIDSALSNSPLAFAWGFLTGKKENTAYTYTSGTSDEGPVSIEVESIRQAIALNTIMWVRANLELSSLIMITAAQIEVEAVLAAHQTLKDKDIEWINPIVIWGASAAKNQGSWLSEGDMMWLAPSYVRDTAE